MRGLAAINLVTHLATRIVHQYFALTTLDENHKVSHQRNDDHNHQGDQNAHGPGAYQLHQTAHSAWQTGCNTGKNQDGNTITQTPLSDLFTQPHQEHGARCQADHRRHAKAKAWCQHQTRRAFKRNRNTHRLKKRQTQGAVARELRDLAAAGFAFFLELLECGNHISEQLHDDGGRDVGHDAQCKDREAFQRAAREHIEQIQNAALLAAEQCLQLGRINTRNRNVCAHAVNDQREQQKHEPIAQVTELAGLCNLGGAGGH